MIIFLIDNLLTCYRQIADKLPTVQLTILFVAENQKNCQPNVGNQLLAWPTCKQPKAVNQQPMEDKQMAMQQNGYNIFGKFWRCKSIGLQISNSTCM